MSDFVLGGWLMLVVLCMVLFLAVGINRRQQRKRKQAAEMRESAYQEAVYLMTRGAKLRSAGRGR